jgi:hypothetical protein
MPAPKGHPLWPSKEKFINPKIFTTPEDLLDTAIQYFQWCDDNPLIKKDFVRGGENAGDIVDLETDRPYLIEGFCNFAGITTQTFDNYSKSKGYEKFFGVSRAIRDTIFRQNLEGGLVGGFNAMLVARKLGIQDKIQSIIDDRRKEIDDLFPPEEELKDDNVKTDKP